MCKSNYRAAHTFLPVLFRVIIWVKWKNSICCKMLCLSLSMYLSKWKRNSIDVKLILLEISVLETIFPIYFQATICISRPLDRSLVTVPDWAARTLQGSVLCACSITCLDSMSMHLWCICAPRQMAHWRKLQMYLAMLEITGSDKRFNWAMAISHTKLSLKVSETGDFVTCDVVTLYSHGASIHPGV